MTSADSKDSQLAPTIGIGVLLAAGVLAAFLSVGAVQVGIPTPVLVAPEGAEDEDKNAEKALRIAWRAFPYYERYDPPENTRPIPEQEPWQPDTAPEATFVNICLVQSAMALAIGLFLGLAPLVASRSVVGVILGLLISPLAVGAAGFGAAYAAHELLVMLKWNAASSIMLPAVFHAISWGAIGLVAGAMTGIVPGNLKAIASNSIAGLIGGICSGSVLCMIAYGLNNPAFVLTPDHFSEISQTLWAIVPPLGIAAAIGVLKVDSGAASAVAKDAGSATAPSGD